MQNISHIDRRQDARKKIQLGGLFVKAELDNFHPDNADVLYGILLDAKLRLQQSPNLVSHFKPLGKDIWIKKEKPQNFIQQEKA